MDQTEPFADEFGALLYHALIEEKRQSVAQISAALGMQQRAFYARLTNGSRFSPQELAVILHKVPDERLAQWLIGDQMTIVERCSATSPTLDEIRRRALLGSLAAAEALGKLLRETGPLYHADAVNRIAEELDKSQSHFLWIRLNLVGQEPSDQKPQPAEFLPLVHRLILTRKGLSIDELGTILKLTYDQIQSRLSGRVEFNQTDIRALLSAFPEPQLANWFLDRTAYIAVPRHAGPGADQISSPLPATIVAVRSVQKLLRMPPSGSGPMRACQRDLWRDDLLEIVSRTLDELDIARSGVTGLISGRTTTSRLGPETDNREGELDDQTGGSRRGPARTGMKTRYSAKFPDFLRHRLSPGSQRTFMEIASGLQVSHQRLRELLMTDTRVSPKEVISLVELTKDAQIANWFFSDSKLTLLDYSENEPDVTDKDLISLLMHAIGVCMDGLLAIAESDRSPRSEVAALQKISDCVPDIMRTLLSAKAKTEMLYLKREEDHNRDRDFISLLKRTLFVNNKIQPSEVATSLGLTEKDLRLRLRSARFKPAEYRALFRAYPEPVLADFLLVGTPYLVSLPPQTERAESVLTDILAGLRPLAKVAASLPPVDERRQMDGEDLSHEIRNAIRQFARVEWNPSRSGVQSQSAGTRVRHRMRIFAPITPMQASIVTVVRPSSGKEA